MEKDKKTKKKMEEQIKNLTISLVKLIDEIDQEAKEVNKQKQKNK